MWPVGLFIMSALYMVTVSDKAAGYLFAGWTVVGL